MRQIKTCMFLLSRMVENPLRETEILTQWPTDEQIENYYKQIHQNQTNQQHPAGWGTAIQWYELHLSDPNKAP
ncbi:hypothetical protein BK816_07720 [Boudabousia tangfeifanii]|uniref:Uncharacterized protein n=1 Tax=Boudabousia tangfeifanii TaxID=1912795 RepID=A0A1D9MML4_9ACTO|nr:hypothetical protein [Boudabousia tangfeifanii]AOZ73532.1 hypothetical protein BK816_07720 [Boudabousia tangfeifanii]